MRERAALPECDGTEIRRNTGERKNGPPIRKMVADALQHRQLLAQKFIDGEWGVDLEGSEAAMDADKSTEIPGERK